VPSALLRTEHATIGTTLWLRLHNGPFPCEGKAYRDATTAVFVPAAYKPQKQIDLLVHFHGHDGLVPHKIVEHQLSLSIFGQKTYNGVARSHIAWQRALPRASRRGFRRRSHHENPAPFVRGT